MVFYQAFMATGGLEFYRLWKAVQEIKLLHFYLVPVMPPAMGFTDRKKSEAQHCSLSLAWLPAWCLKKHSQELRAVRCSTAFISVCWG